VYSSNGLYYLYPCQGASNLSTIGLTKKLRLVPRLVADWKQSSARGGARTAVILAKAHYPGLDLDLITSDIPESNEDGTPVDEAAIRQSMLGYDQLCALVIHLKRIYNFLCSILVYKPFALCFVTLRGVFMHFLELTY
jgi:hypothetical protein